MGPAHLIEIKRDPGVGWLNDWIMPSLFDAFSRLLPLRQCAGIAALIVLLQLAACGRQAHTQPGPPPAPAVSVMPAVEQTVVDVEEFSGRIEAVEYVELRPRVSGVINQVHFADGAMVNKGQLLFTIDPVPFAIEVARTEAQLAVAKERAALASSDRRRTEALAEANAISKQEYDQIVTRLNTSDAEIKAAQAALNTARVNLAYASVRAPIAGRISRTAVTAGNLVNDQVVLTTIAGVQRVYAYFDSSEQTFLRLKANKDTSPEVAMSLANENGFPHRGRIDFVDNRLNPLTGAIRLRASFDNSRGQFVPGLAARLKMPVSEPYRAVLVPERAIGTDQTRKTVYVVGKDGMPQVRDVKTGALFGTMRVVQGGVKPGEHVVVDGLQRVMPGVRVSPVLLRPDAQDGASAAAQASQASARPART